MVPADRIAAANAQPIRDGAYVLYWMIAHRRMAWNHALDRAIEHARVLGRPLVVCEYLRSGHAFGCDRLHALMLDGMREHRDACVGTPVHYLPFIEEAIGSGAAWMRRLLAGACVVVSDEFPCYVHPRMVANLAAEAPCLVETVDANGLFPLRAGLLRERAVDFRRLLQRSLAPHLGRFPTAQPLRGLRLPRLAEGVLPAGSDLDRLDLAHLPIDHAVGRVDRRGGHRAAQARLAVFLDQRLARYGERNDPAADSASSLSSDLHLGHLSAHEVVQAVWDRAGWTPDAIGPGGRGSKDGWWGLDPASEDFLDQIITWRELGYHYCFRQPRYADYATLPAWALATLDAHRSDARPYRYTRDQFAAAATHDPIWNAAQRQLLGSGLIHNYLRMLWGKKVIEWSATPEDAWATLDHLNNRWAIDGCNPNSWTGIAWCFGRFDRPWGPSRKIFGAVRWMSSDQTRRKLDLNAYLARWG